jgi:hypothetical protein
MFRWWSWGRWSGPGDLDLRLIYDVLDDPRRQHALTWAIVAKEKSSTRLFGVRRKGDLMMKGLAVLLMLVLSLVAGGQAQSQGRTVAPDLRALVDGKETTIPVEATLKWVENANGRPALMMQATKDDTVIVLPGTELTNGVVEFDALGQSNPRGSNFLGFAFRVVDAQTHDAVYFRPFNFRAADPEQRAHAVQYISHPKYRWEVLRSDKPGQYEKPIVPAPDGDAWFHVRILIEKPTVRVYVNDGQAPSLVVDELSDRKGGGVGLWVGPEQGGYIANLTITPAR